MGVVVETIDAIGVTRISRWIFNCYLIHDGGDGAPVVIDAGLSGVVHDLVAVMDSLGLALPELAGIFATHGHSDHVGGAPALSAQSGAPICLPSRTLSYVAGEIPRSPSAAAIARIWPTVFDQPFDRRGALDAMRGAKVAGYGTSSGMRWPAERRLRPLVDGDCLPGAPAWQVITSPGHTDDSLSFWHPGTATLLSGDAVLSVDGRAWITPETVDDGLNADTAARLRRLDVAHLLPGHGRPVHGAAVTARAWAPDDHPRRLASVCGAVTRRLGGRGASTRSTRQ